MDLMSFFKQPKSLVYFSICHLCVYVYFSEKYIHFRLYTIVLAKYFVSGQTYYLQMILGIRRFH